MTAIPDTALSRAAPVAWGAVGAMTLCVSALIASEFLPVSLLTPIAADLGLSEGQAGQSIAISGLFAVLTSLTVARVTRGIDRRLVLAGFALLLALSGLIVTFAPEAVTLMAGRALLGVAIGGFWSMSTAIVMRLLPEAEVPRGLALLNAGNAVAATVAAPLGAYLGDLVGWRGAFFAVVPLALAALAWQWRALPPLPPRRRPAQPGPLRLLARPQVRLGMAAILMLFAGQFALFTYLRPFLQHVAGWSVPQLSLGFLTLGAAGIAGTWWISRLLDRRLFSILIAIPLVMAGLAAALIAFANAPVAVAALLFAWGFFGTAAPVGWGTWLARVMGEDAEAGGGLQVAVIQAAITLGAALGGLVFDGIGWWGAFGLAGLMLLGSSGLAVLAWRHMELTT